MIRDTMRRLHDEGAGRDEVRAMLLAQPTVTGGDLAAEATAATIESRVDAFLACDPSVFDPAITGDAIGGWDPDTPIPESVPLTLLRADSALHPAFLPDDEARFLRAAPTRGSSRSSAHPTASTPSRHRPTGIWPSSTPCSGASTPDTATPSHDRRAVSTVEA